MNITAINNTYHGTFNGLWGSGNANSKGQSGQLAVDQTYYRFLDEAREQKIAGASIATASVLPFTSKEFLQYTKNRLSIIKTRLIDRYMTSKGLSLIKK